MNKRTFKNPAAFAGLLLEQGYHDLQRYFSRRLGNRQDVRELTQEVWLRLCRVNDRERLRQPMAYVYRTAANVLAEFRLRRRREPLTLASELTYQEAPGNMSTAPDEMAERAEAQHDLLAALGDLSPAFRQIVWMRLCENRSFQEIGAAVGFSEATTRRYYFRAVKQLWKAEWQ